MMNGERKVAVVTGAAKGIGQELAARLAGRGDALALLEQDGWLHVGVSRAWSVK